jgi:hypothetical protein
VGKGQIGALSYPGRIQTVGETGFSVSIGGAEVYIQNGSYYLADNPNYTYYWVNYAGHTPANSVFARSTLIPYPLAAGKAKINGHMEIGFVSDPVMELTGVLVRNFEVLVCDPWPKYQCGKFVIIFGVLNQI